jgi:hypothetical protein
MKVRGISVALVVVFLTAFNVVAQDKSTATIKGKVRVEKGSPAGVAVALLQGEQEITRVSTDKNGGFVISRIAPGTYSVKFRKPGLMVGTIDEVTLKAGQTRTFHDLSLGVDEGSLVFIRGSVFDENGRSVPGVRVELAKVVDENSIEKIDSRITGETGEFVFRLGPGAAKYRVTLKADRAQPESKDVEVESPAVYRVALTLKPVPK